jgi:hypothetical protein
MDHSKVVDFANQLGVALGQREGATEYPEIYQEGKSKAVSHAVKAAPTHTEYLWWDGHGYAGISHELSVDSEILGVKNGANVVGTTDPLPVEFDPSPSFEWDLIPYDRVTASKLILAVWMKAPGKAPLYAKKPMGRAIFRLDHEGAFDFRWLKLTDEGIAGGANLNLLDGENRNTVLRLVQEMHHGHFIEEWEADTFISDLDFRKPDLTAPETTEGAQNHRTGT